MGSSWALEDSQPPAADQWRAPQARSGDAEGAAGHPWRALDRTCARAYQGERTWAMAGLDHYLSATVSANRVILDKSFLIGPPSSWETECGTRALHLLWTLLPCVAAQLGAGIEDEVDGGELAPFVGAQPEQSIGHRTVMRTWSRT